MSYKTDLQGNNADLQEILNLVNALPDAAEPVIEPLEVTENGTYAAPDGVDGYSPVTVNVPVPEGYVRPSGTLNITENGEYDVTEKTGVVVSVESVDYAPSSRTYEITLAKASGWVLLTTLDDDVLAHINDPGLVVSLMNMSGYAYEFYGMSMAVASNTAQAMQGGYPQYGTSGRQSNETTASLIPLYYPLNKTTTETGLGGTAFRLDGNKYYFHPADGFIRTGTYKLTFTW